MSDLQISLLIIGAAVVGAVYVFNRLQERKFRRSLGDAFESGREDVLLKSAGDAGERVEPSLQAGPMPEPPPEPMATSAMHDPSAGIDDGLDYVTVVNAGAPIAESVIAELLGRVAGVGKPWRAEGLNAETGEWEDLARGSGAGYSALRVALQLVNRAGPVQAAQLGILCDAIRNCAKRCSGTASCPDSRAALDSASELDGFCAEVDVAIGVNVVSVDGAPFQGSRIRALAEAAGFRLEPDGVFRMRDERRRTLFTLDNHEPAPFIPEQMQTLATGGVTLLLDVPLVVDGVAAFDRMLEVGRELASSLGGSLVDDNRAALNAVGIARIRQQLAGIHAKMEARGISAGGALALRLFA